MKNYLKITVSLLLIGALIYNVEWEAVLSNMKTMSMVSIIIAFSIFTVQFPISAYKWQKSLRFHGLEYSFGFLQKVLCIGFFFNNFLPTSIGGDAYRVIKTVPKEGFKSRAVSAILVERIIGLCALLLLGLIGGIVTLGNESIPVVSYFVFVCLAGVFAFILLLLLLKLGLFSGLLVRLKRIEKLEMLTHNLGLIYRNPGALVNIFIISLLFQALAIVAISVLFEALGSDGGYAKYAIIAAIVGLAGMLPISINGIGVTEGAFAVTATQLGMDFDQAVIVAFMLRILVVPLSLGCGLVYLVDGRRVAS